jgi:hypothetical protein
MADSSSPPPSSSSRAVVSRLDRASLERVLARAAELQGTAADTESSEQFTEEQLIELGKEVGLSPQNLRQALAEERTRSAAPEDERGLAASMFGPGRITAARTVPGKASEVLEAIDIWMQRQETLIVKRHHPDRIVWEPSREFGVAIKRAFKPGGRDFALANAFEVAATVIAIDDVRSHVVLEGDFRSRRTRVSMQVAGGVGLGGVLSGALMFTALPVIVAAAPVVAISALGVFGGRQLQARVVTRAQLALEQLLDRLERGELKRRGAEGLLGAIGAAATSVPPRRF